MKDTENYERYGEEWRKEAAKLSKAELLIIMAKMGKERDKLREEVQQLNRLLNERSFEQEPDYDNQAKEYEADQREASAPTQYEP